MIFLGANKRGFFFLVALLTASVAVAPFLGMTCFSVSELMSLPSDAMEHHIFFQMRLPRVLVAFLSGAALSLGGMVFQAMFKNALATPFTLGVAGGASFGASMYIRLGLMFSVLGIPGVTIAAFGGALLSISLVFGLTKAGRNDSTNTMLLAGVGLSFFFSSAIFFAQYLSDFTQSFQILRWLMGGLAVQGYTTFFDLLPIVSGGALVILYFTHDLNALTTGEEEAIGRGVNVSRTRTILFFTVSLMVAAVVAACGPIGFVGMMAPHICRLLIGADHRLLTWASMLFGGFFLTWCDVLSRTLIAPAEIPVGVITALLGGPFFIWLLVSQKYGRQR
ncbi:MAG: iron ABC transporter permease [Deltaproteobacteria bacterium]|nr:iron ABC transporter permease [Deltaproteobacteria bacterium]MBN2674505.1 iron ABC transporter permease [Deltaproteobacteria bacterium]